MEYAVFRMKMPHVRECAVAVMLGTLGKREYVIIQSRFTELWSHLYQDFGHSSVTHIRKFAVKRIKFGLYSFAQPPYYVIWLYFNLKIGFDCKELNCHDCNKVS